MSNDLGPHGVTNSISVDEDMVWELTVVVLSEGLEGTLKVLLEHSGTDNLLTLLTLRASLSVVLAHVLIVCGTESDDALLTLVTDVNSNEHGLL